MNYSNNTKKYIILQLQLQYALYKKESKCKYLITYLYFKHN